MDALTDATLAFIGENRAWALWIALVFAAAETTAFLSILIPSTAILFGVGALVATGGLDFTPIWIGASLGAMLGSFFSYWLGWRFGPRALEMWPMRDHRALIHRGTQAFARWGAFTVLIGHFFGPLRAVVFVMAGVSRLPAWQFVPVNILGCIAWAWATPKSGEIGGNILGYLWSLVTGG
ncbi:membrane protein DedA with SNARE-associated domain [Cereibacter ovatus]|uniref:Membrane protein DedA with SNARE-associated domain n=1 Tax=Cereibacter ovatus TaxID=439529 RepID=A0A285D0T5_9RHOB|nr:DedA family protein [Cereibacter ovatus]SNX73424.1 membrane protein DedA with SNARE-associated domain [Cereibacter ovatus]